MRTNIVAIAAICTTIMACNNSKTETVVTNRVDLAESLDNEAFDNNVESIDVLNLQMDDDWVFDEGRAFGLSDNYLYMLCGEQIRITCHNLQSGEKLAGRVLRGNGPGELNGLGSEFCVGDTLCVLDEKGVIFQYDHNGRFLGKKHEFGESFSGLYMLSLKNGDYVLISHKRISTDSIYSQVLLTDKSFNIKSEHFNMPLPRVFIYPSGGSEKPYCANGDTIRFFFYNNMDNHLYSLCGDSEQCIELVLPDPQTAEAYIDAMNEIMRTRSWDAFNKLGKLNGSFGNLCESGRFVCFNYQLDLHRQIAMIDKRTNKAVSIWANMPVYEIFCNMKVLYSDGEYIYAKCKNRRMAEILEGNDYPLDDRLKETQAQYHAYLERNAEYLKDLDEDERDAANVILKIKLKD